MFQLEIATNKKVIAKKHLTNSYEINSRSLLSIMMYDSYQRWNKLWLTNETCFL